MLKEENGRYTGEIDRLSTELQQLKEKHSQLKGPDMIALKSHVAELIEELVKERQKSESLMKYKVKCEKMQDPQA